MVQRRPLIFIPRDLAQTTVLDFDGSTEKMRSANNVTLGIANSWSFMILAKSDRNSALENIFSTGNPSNNEIRFDNRGDETNDPVGIILRNSSGTAFKSFYYPGFIQVGNWHLWTVTWDGTSLKVYRNTTEQSPSTTFINNSGTMTNSSDRKVRIGSNNANQGFDGRIAFVALWDAVLDSDDVTEIENDGFPGRFNLKGNTGNYDKASNLVHWWRLGHTSTDNNTIGDDYKGSISVSEDAVDMTTADVVTDEPEIF